MSKLPVDLQKDIQGFIFSAYGHLSFAAFLFLEIESAERGRALLRRLIPRVTTAEDWKKRPDGTKEKPETTLNLAFTYAGFGALGLPPTATNTFSREFIMGMSDRAGILGDQGESAPEHWHFGGPENPPIHAVVFLYGIDPPTLDRFIEQVRHLVKETGGVREVGWEKGARYTDREPFGFHDGVSQPQVELIDDVKPSRNVVRLGEFLLGHKNEYELLPPTAGVQDKDDPDKILPPFPTLPDYRDLGRNGTYLAYRKLVQDVPGFWRFIAQSSHAEGGVSEEHRHQAALYLAAKFVGRWPSGAPLVLSPEEDDPKLGDANNFDYTSTDRQGLACPIGSHIRRSNPRDSLADDTVDESYQTTNRHRIIRRAITFGITPDDPVDQILNSGRAPLDLPDSGTPCGIHFFSVNASLANQFEFVQQTWSNNVNFNGLFNDRDPVIGNNEQGTFMTVPCQPVRKVIQKVPRFVNVQGGVYLFMPSMTALRFLAGPPIPEEPGDWPDDGRDQDRDRDRPRDDRQRTSFQKIDHKARMVRGVTLASLDAVHLLADSLTTVADGILGRSRRDAHRNRD